MKKVKMNEENKKDKDEKIVVSLFILNNKNEVLVERKSRKNGGRFAFLIINSDNLDDGIMNETYKNIGLKIANPELINSIKDNDITYSYYVYKNDININKLVLQEDEVEDVKWVSIDGIIDMIQKDTFFEKHISMVHIINKYLHG